MLEFSVGQLFHTRSMLANFLECCVFTWGSFLRGSTSNMRSDGNARLGKTGTLAECHGAQSLAANYVDALNVFILCKQMQKSEFGIQKAELMA